MIITIDGPAGSGKSTVADILAEKLGFTHFNSGSVFRGITAYLLDINFNISSITETSPIPNFNLKVELNNGIQHVFVNNKDYTSVLRNNNISATVPFVSLNQNVQHIAQQCLKEFCALHNVVIEGRGLGNEVLVNAEYKIYLDCSIKERAKRRFNEEKLKNSSITLQEIEKQIEQRDLLDRTRTVAPLVIPKNAFVVDSSNLTINQVVETILSHIKL